MRDANLIIAGACFCAVIVAVIIPSENKKMKASVIVFNAIACIANLLEAYL